MVELTRVSYTETAGLSVEPIIAFFSETELSDEPISVSYTETGLG